MLDPLLVQAIRRRLALLSQPGLSEAPPQEPAPAPLPELPDRFKNASSENLDDDLLKVEQASKKAAEHYKKNPIDPKKYKGRKVEFNFEEDK